MVIERIEDKRIRSITTIKPPIELRQAIVNESVGLVEKTRQDILDILYGRDTRRLLAVVGPCSIHDPVEALEYAHRLIGLRNQLEDDLIIVAREYFEKPRTTRGWPGLVYDPNLNGSAEGGNGLAVSRKILADVNKLGLPCAVEFMDPDTPQYLGDLVSWVAIGARTVASPPHRKLASGLSMPVGFKNFVDGNVQLAVDAMVTARDSHTIFGINLYGILSEIATTGNPDTHIVLRGGSNGTNYDTDSVTTAVNLIRKSGLLTESGRPIMIDCSHDNTINGNAKDFRLQTTICDDVAEQFRAGQSRIMGVMIESNLVEGQQKVVEGQPLKWGMSTTDGCIGWEETERLLVSFARKIRLARYAVA